MISAKLKGDAEATTFTVAKAQRAANRDGQLLSDCQPQAGSTGAAVA